MYQHFKIDHLYNAVKTFHEIKYYRRINYNNYSYKEIVPLKRLALYMKRGGFIFTAQQMAKSFSTKDRELSYLLQRRLSLAAKASTSTVIIPKIASRCFIVFIDYNPMQISEKAG